MVEYIYDAIKATSGSNIIINAKVTDSNGNEITGDMVNSYVDENYNYNGCYDYAKEEIENAMWLFFKDDTKTICGVGGNYENGMWTFELPGEMSEKLKGRYWYVIHYKGVDLSFKQPIYLV